VFRVGEDPLDLPALISSVEDERFGAVVAFLGIVRRSGEAGEIDALEYSAYAEMAVLKMHEIGRELEEQFGPLRIAATHRTGRLPVGTPSLALAVACPHRGQAWRAAEKFVDRLKEVVPIWKVDIPVEGGKS